jgi:acylphosphatase
MSTKQIDMTGFVRAAQDGAVTVVFKKIYDGEIRTMPCTLNRELSKGNVPELIEQKDASDNIAVWALDKDAWRSFRVDTVLEWYKGYPVTEQQAS